MAFLWMHLEYHTIPKYILLFLFTVLKLFTPISLKILSHFETHWPTFMH